MLKRPVKQDGVGLIEIMIGVAIVALMLSLAAPSYSTFIQNSQIRNAAEAIQNGLQLARAEAVQRNTPIQFVLGTKSAWSVGCVTASADCPAVIQTRSEADGSTRGEVATSEVVASSGAVAGSPVFTTTLVFNGLGRERTLPAANNAVFDITNPAGTCVTNGGKMRCLRVVVTAGGQIRMCDRARPVTTPPDPQAC
jgi:type IV fimbrial biogenesis protein FimT